MLHSCGASTSSARLKRRYENLLQEMEDRVRAQRDAAQKNALLERESAMVAEVARREEAARFKREQEAIELEREREAAIAASEDAARQRELADGQKKLNELKAKLRELWGVTEADPADISTFLSDLLSELSYTPDALCRCNDEVARLNSLLPIVELVNRREFVKFRMAEFAKTATDPARLFRAEPGRLLKEDKQRGEFVRELGRLNEKLVPALSAYEAQFGTFVWRGVPYLARLGADVADVERSAEASYRSPVLGDQ
eukprot:gnl/Ergobibamus_cyprinoides/1013.p1 GENE.gnl/Ergobibamus_cyprinoides/1013~~gnl/Ergobibamus_cyprinoides/1013.p1  ORF type:complete len:286 (-),score=69.61 gnl/Ergobibamus_cyprinoides/1013:51-821(-)